MVVLGIGKSVIAAELFVRMKLLNLKTELITEYAKDLVYEQRQQTISDQIYIFGKMQHKLNIVSQFVDYAIVDSPLLLSLVYKKRIPKLKCISDDVFKSLVLQVYNSYNNIDICLQRDLKNYNYEQYGRLQNLNESIEIDNQIEKCIFDCIKQKNWFVTNHQNDFNKTVDEIMNTIIKPNIIK